MVDILNVYRPADELPGLARLAVGLGAKALWLQPGSTSPEAKEIAAAGGLAFIEDVDIAEAVRSSGMPLR
jgi:predicted CoA-binding protein